MKLHNIFSIHEDMDHMVFNNADDLREFSSIVVLDKPECVKYYSIHAKKFVNVGSACISDKDDAAVLNGILSRHGQEAFDSISSLNNAAYWASIAGKAYYWEQQMLILAVDTPDEYKQMLRNNLRIFRYCCLDAVDSYSSRVNDEFLGLCVAKDTQWRVDWFVQRSVVEQGLVQQLKTLTNPKLSSDDVSAIKKEVTVLKHSLMIHSMRMSAKDTWKETQRRLFRGAIEHRAIQLAKQNQQHG